ncbi:MAG: carboxypeptidase regulatory-like domain-containing protein [Bryobacteraceae bacterium]
MRASRLGLAAFVILSPFRAAAQATDGNVTGVVFDTTGAAIAGAGVELLNAATGVKSNTATDVRGAYRFGNVPIGKYTITVTAAGFAPASLKDVAVELNRTATANLTLNVGNVSTAVEVSEAAALIDSTTAQITNTYERRLATEHPLSANPSGGVYNLSLIGAGVASSGGIGAGTGPSVGGIRPRNNNFTVEGVDNNNKNVTGPIIYLPNDAVGEFSVMQNQFSAEFGRGSGGQFNVTVKSGTNEIHGSIYEYLLNRRLNANDQAAARQGIFTPPRYDQNRLGGQAGGPLLRNRWFLYGLYEYNPEGRASVPAQPVLAPTEAGYGLLSAMPGVSRGNLEMLRKYAPPAATRTRDTPVNGVQIPIGIFTVVRPSYSNTYNWLVSSDYSIGAKDQLRARYITNDNQGLDTGAALPQFFTPQPVVSRMASAGYFHSFAPNVNNELRVAWNSNRNTRVMPDLGWPGLDVFPNAGIRNDLNLNIGPNNNTPGDVNQNTYQVVNNLSWTKGRHDLKFGLDFRFQRFASTYVPRARGDYQWTTLERYLNDTIPDFIAQRNVGGLQYNGNVESYYGFANDNFRLRQNLTINVGIRYERNGVAKSMQEFDLNKLADVPGVLTFRAPTPTNRNFAPRVGFAWSPGRSGKTSIRGGFGIGYDSWFDNIGTQARPPQANSNVDITGNPGTGFLARGGIPASARAATLTPAEAKAQTSYLLDPVQRLPYAITMNVGVQRSFANDYTMEVRYVGTKGVHLLMQGQLNRNSLVTGNFNLPTYLEAPSQATLNALTINTNAFTQLRQTAAWNPLLPYGFTTAIITYQARGNSRYHGLAIDLKKRYSKNLMFIAAYTLSRTIDDSTAELNSIVATPRRPQDFNNYRAERSFSPLDRRHRFTFTPVFNTPWLSSHKNPLLRGVIGNWQLSGTYTAETGTWATPQSGVDSNQNGDSATDRVILNPKGTPGTSSGVTALRNSSNQTVAYLAQNPSAQFILAQIGALADSGRNILRTPGINNIDLTIAKNIPIREHRQLQIRADLFNAANHPQYTLGNIDSIRLRNTSGNANMFVPGNPLFGRWDQVFSSNPRIAQITAKFTF